MKSLFVWRALATVIYLSSVVCATDYVVDPVSGSMTNPGTSARPWSTLEAVFSSGKLADVRGGDRLLLRRGYHGGPVISGTALNASTTNPVVITADAGHAPVMKWMLLNSAKYWVIQDLFINHALGAGDSGALITLQNSSDYNTLRNISACSTQEPLGWAENEAGWIGGARNGIEVKFSGGSFNTFDHVYWLNVNNGIICNDSGNLYQYTVLENFTLDGIRPDANNLRFYYNTVMNAVMNDHTKVYADRAHRDMWQEIVGTVSGIEMVGNTMIAVADPTLPVCDFSETSTTKYMEAFMPAFAGWDGPFNNCTFENNVIFTNHTTGIWLNAATNCHVINNTMVKISDNHPSFQPRIKIGSKTATSTPSSNNIVYNNICVGALTLSNGGDQGGGTSSVSGAGNNLVVPWSSAPSVFLSRGFPYLDAHLKSTAAGAINTANASMAPATDADGVVRTTADIGAYEYGTYVGVDTVAPSTPGQPRVFLVAGLGADLSWAASTDNRTVTGYDVYRNGTRVGRARNGARFFDLYTGNTAGLSYTVKAFDRSGNVSGASPAGSPVTALNVPTLTWATPTAIIYGTALSAAQLNATADVAGTFVYTPASGSLLNAGSQVLHVTFTPADTTHYTSTAASVTLTVNKAPVTVTWATPTAITYGTALSSAQLNASSATAGTFAYTPATGTVLNAGTQSLSVLFTPTNTNYATTAKTVTLVVNKAPTTLSWSTPAPITSGTALSATQLNATASVAGSFVYTPAAGTILPAGTQTLLTNFTPTSANYTTASASVSLLVNTTTTTSPHFVMGININGSAAVINGNSWISHSTALTRGFSITSSAPSTSPPQFGTSTITPSPAVDAATSGMLNAVVWAAKTFSLDQTIANGRYDAYFWTMENYQTNFRAFNISLEGNLAATGVGRQVYGTWQKYGPYAVTVADGQLHIDITSTSGNPCLSGMEMWSSSADTLAPSIPGGVTAALQTATSMQITWTASTDNIGVTGYDVYSNGVLVGSTTTTTFLRSGLALATNYSYTVIAKDAAGNRSAASAASIPISTGPAFVMGINMNGEALTINGNAWRSYATALTQGLSLTAPATSPVQLGTSPVIPNPATDAATTFMLSTVTWAESTFTVNQTLSSGNYQVYLWIMENYQSNFRAINVTAEGSLVATGIGQLPFGGWNRYGPYAVAVTDGSLTMTMTKTKGNPDLMGLEIYQVAPPTGIAGVARAEHTLGTWAPIPSR